MIFDRVHLVESKDSQNYEISLSVGVCGESSESDVCLLFLHGAASSKETWHNQIKALSAYFLLLAPDMRSHGESPYCDDLALDSLVHDVSHIIQDMASVIGTRRIVAVGHSVGGSVATRVAVVEPRVAGVIVIDVVEETALESLQHMPAVLEQWPNSFSRVADCINWSTNLHRPQCSRSASISIPPLLRLNEETGMHEWKTSLISFRGDWESWFTGFDSAFLSLRQPHCLLLASAERLDRKMSAAHVQGLYELHVMHGGIGGHFVQEDNPEETLGILVNFMMRGQLITPSTATAILLSGLSTAAIPASYRSPLPFPVVPAQHVPHK